MPECVSHWIHHHHTIKKKIIRFLGALKRSTIITHFSSGYRTFEALATINP